MSRSRRRRKPGKCVCGRVLVPFLEFVGQRKPYNPGCPHPVMEDVHAENERFLKFKRQQQTASNEGDL